MKLKKYLKAILIFLLPIFFLNFLVFTLAWSPPSQAPPGGNVPTFLSESNISQFKEGALGIGGVFQAFLVQLVPGEGATTPTCNAASRGTMWLEEGGAGEDDELLYCKKNSSDEYVWEKVEWYTWSCGDDFTDPRDSKVYSTVDIGGQCWFAENLAYLPSVVGSGTGSSSDPYYYVYDYNGTDISAAKATTNYQTYGVLYNWPAAMSDDEVDDGDTTTSVQGICPEGWSLPSDSDLHTLENYLATETCDSSRTTWGCDPAGSKLAGNASLWGAGVLKEHANFGSSGFVGLPGGRRLSHGSFDGLGTTASFWSSSPSGGVAWFRYLNSSDVGVYRTAFGQANGFSVRCLRD